MLKRLIKNGGQITLITTMIVAGTSIFASVITSWGFASTKVSVIEEREQNHYQEVQKQLESIEKKLDSVISSHQVIKIKK